MTEFATIPFPLCLRRPKAGKTILTVQYELVHIGLQKSVLALAIRATSGKTEINRRNQLKLDQEGVPCKALRSFIDIIAIELSTIGLTIVDAHFDAFGVSKSLLPSSELFSGMPLP